MKIEILLADDQLLILEGIKAILEPEPGISVVGTAQDGQTAIALVRELRPDILLIDIEMPKMNGILATKYICKYLPSTKVIVLTSHKNQDYIAEALLAGASGYLWKGNLIRDLKQEIYSFGKGYSGVKAKLLTNGHSQAYAKRYAKALASRRSLGSSFYGGVRVTQTAKKNSPINAVEYQEKIIYFQKYRKNIYKPAVHQKKQQRLRKTSNIRLANPGIVKAGLDPTFEPLTAKEIRATNPKTFSPLGVYNPLRFNRRKYLKRIIWLLLAISSIVLSIIIF